MELFREQFNQVARAIAELARRVRRLETLANFAPVTQTVEGEEIDVGTLSWGKILVIPPNPVEVLAFPPNNSGLLAAVSVANIPGSIIWVVPGIYDPSPFTINIGVGLASMGDKAEINTTITLSPSSFLDSIVQSRTVSDAGNVAGIIGPSSGLAYVADCSIVLTNSGAGDAYSVQGDDGELLLWNCYLDGRATGGGDGYGIAEGAGEIYMEGGYLSGSTAPATSSGSGTSYTAGAEISTGAITVTASSGVQISGLSIGTWYAVEAFNGPFNTDPAFPGGTKYTFNVSNDGGGTWGGRIGAEAPDPGGPYTEYLELPSWGAFAEMVDSFRGRFYFQATTTSIRIRVDDVSNWGDNTGTLSWRLRSATVTGATVITNAVRMDPVVGEPSLGDKGVWNVDDFPERHASDINAGAHKRHLPEPTTEDKIAVVDNVAGELVWVEGDATASSDIADSNAIGGPDPNFFVDGRLVVVSGVGGSYVAPRAMSIEAIYIYCKTPGTASSTKIDINLNGTTVFTIQADRPDLDWDNANQVAYAIPHVVGVAKFDVLTIDIDQIGTGAESLSVIIVFGPAIDETVSPIPDFSVDIYKPGTTTDNVVLNLGAGGEFDDVYCTSPCAVEFEGNVYLFYGGNDGATERIGVAVEAVDGFTGVGFTKSGSNPIIDVGAGGAWDDTNVGEPWVIYDEEEAIWKMWYVGNDGATIHIGYATASDPTGPWTKSGSNPVMTPAGWEGSILGSPIIIKLGTKSYKMLYHGNSVTTGSDIGLATSEDGISWTKYGSNPVLTNAGTGWMQKSTLTPRTLTKKGETYYLYYTGKPTSSPDYSKCGYAYSSDLIVWTVDTANPILTATRSWEGVTSPPGEVEYPTAIKVGTNWYIFYFCWYGTPKTIGVTIVPEADIT